MRLDIRKAIQIAAGAWLYALLWALPPVFGWSSYTTEGPGTWCSVLWQSSDPIDVSYIITLFFFCFFIPVVIMVVCYYHLYREVRRMARQTSIEQDSSAGRENIRREKKVAKMTIVVWAAFLIAWTPYATVALISTFGDASSISYMAAALPSVMAKSATVYNPFIYVAMNERFRRAAVNQVPCLKLLIKIDEDEGVAEQSDNTTVTHAAPAVQFTSSKRSPPIQAIASPYRVDTASSLKTETETKASTHGTAQVTNIDVMEIPYDHTRASTSRAHPL
ncbi:melanopsin-like [Lingula anatina]|uniref:Melanopsin-like n=1 Tax=Lingula anatina TaxID=7574 RepID=A0A1S3I794_LINAN|nr:melanopsin-like [Lingula anatina]|eukprot:XP_013394150.1 melanopsin-like [Lingula anatina]